MVGIVCSSFKINSFTRLSCNFTFKINPLNVRKRTGLLSACPALGFDVSDNIFDRHVTEQLITLDGVITTACPELIEVAQGIDYPNFPN